MEKDKVYFSTTGLTSTSANHVANMAKEAVQTAQKELENTSFITTTIGLIGSNDMSVTHYGVTSLDYIKKDLDLIVKAHSLIAWLREALKAKDNLKQETSRLQLLTWCQQNGKEYPVLPEEQTPLTKEDILATWSIKDRNKYLALGAKVSAYGKLLHQGGIYSKAREELKDKLGNPTKVSLNGRDTIIESYTDSIASDTVDDTFFALQREWRSAQAELNGLEHKLQLAVDKDTNEKNSLYAQQCDDYEKKMSALNAEFKAWKDVTLQEIAALKIIIPNDLTDIYKEVVNLSK